MKWWGWGSPDVEFRPSGRFLQRIEEVLGPPQHASRERATARRARPVSLPVEAKTDDETRLRFSTGRSYLDLIDLRSGKSIDTVDAVVSPRSIEDVEAILGARNIALVPFGGGTSVVGGVAPVRGDHDAVVALDMSRFCRVLDIDKGSMTVTAEAGIFGPRLEASVQPHGLTLGHFPQSFEYSTLGGWLATRSSGQESTRYGRIEDLVAAVSAVTPRGRIAAGHSPASSTGPELREILVGSEGAFGLIVEATMKLHPLPSLRVYRSYVFRDFTAGVEACRELLQSLVRPAVLRLSDETETELSLDLSSAPELVRRVLRFMGRRPGAHLLLAFDDPERELAVARRIVRKLGGIPLGSSPGHHWARDRFRHPYLRDALIDRGYMVDTFETAAPWSRLHSLYDAVRASAPGLAGCHVSHAYTDGASLYFTVIERVCLGDERAQWQELKNRISEAIVTHGGTISHHHGVGLHHKPWLGRERGERGLSVLRSIKGELDPFGIMNPGKLL
jgi:alkyldihydroxyacetonephosphate synthase